MSATYRPSAYTLNFRIDFVRTPTPSSDMRPDDVGKERPVRGSTTRGGAAGADAAIIASPAARVVHMPVQDTGRRRRMWGFLPTWVRTARGAPARLPGMWIALGVLVFGLLLAGGVTGIVLEVRKSAARAEALRALAASLDLTAVTPEELVRGERPGEADVWDAAGVAFRHNRNNRGVVSNLYHGEREGRDFWLFDYAHERAPRSGNLRATVVSVGVRGPLPSLDLLPRGDGLVFTDAGTRLVCHGAPAADGRTPVGGIPALLEAALDAARRLGA